jgi:hypothetical protein
MMAVFPALSRQQPELGRLTRRLDDAARQLAELPRADTRSIQLLCLDNDKLYYLPLDLAHDLSAARREQLQTMLSAALGMKVRLVRAEEA